MTDWTPIIAIAEVVAAVAVVASLVYLALQVRQNTRSVRAATYDAMVRASGDFLLPIIQDASLARAFEQAVARWSDPSIDEERRTRVMYVLTQLFRSWENAFYQHRQGTLEDWLWKAWERVILSYFHQPGIQDWWQVRRGAYSQPFCEFLETSACPPHDIKTTEQLLTPKSRAVDPGEAAV